MAEEQHKHRVCAVDGVKNVRDAGGLPIGQSTRSRSGLLFRAGSLSGVTAKGTQDLKALGIRHVFDLRDPKEAATSGLPDLAGMDAEYHTAPMFDMALFPMRRNGKPWPTLTNGFAPTYIFCLDEGRSCFAKLVRLLLQTGGNEPVVFACHVRAIFAFCLPAPSLFVFTDACLPSTDWQG